MTSKVLQLEEILQPDRMGSQITDLWLRWDSMRQIRKTKWEEIAQYVYATDTSTTTNSSLPWKNRTTVPKLCQVHDNLMANYKYALFPQRKNVEWMANEKDSNSKRKRDSITNYMTWVLSQPMLKHEMDKILMDWVQKGNCFATIEWMDQRIKQDNGTQSGYVGPMIKRINPYDIVFNPTAENFQNSPKIIRSLISKGDLRELLERLSVDDNREEYETMWNYLKDVRDQAANTSTDWQQRDTMYSIEGFSSFREYLASDTVEILTFYGDLYDSENDKLWKNHVITVIDRHKIAGLKPNPSYFGYPPIFHAAWRKRPDNLWGMGPLDNLVGMQYRMDHVENMKADIMDLATYPVQKIKGFVEDFTWQPGEKIYVSEEGDVELHSPDVHAGQINFEIQNLERLMEEMAGAPREAMGFRTPGEKTKYEVQRMENAASRIFQNKTYQFSEDFEEPCYTAMLEMGRRLMTGINTINVFDDELKFQSFQTITAEDITGVGRIVPNAARHFAEQAELVQNLTSLTQSQMWPTVQPHFSGVKLAKIFEKVFNLEDYEVVIPFVALSEQAMGQQQAQALQEQTLQSTMTASGMGDDFDMSAAATPPPQLPDEGQAPPQ